MKKKIGIKAYGHEHLFKNKREFRAFLLEWIAVVDGCERRRPTDALLNLEAGVTYTDTDAPDEPITPEEFNELCKLYAPKH